MRHIGYKLLSCRIHRHKLRDRAVIPFCQLFELLESPLRNLLVKLSFTDYLHLMIHAFDSSCTCVSDCPCSTYAKSHDQSKHNSIARFHPPFYNLQTIRGCLNEQNSLYLRIVPERNHVLQITIFIHHFIGCLSTHHSDHIRIDDVCRLFISIRILNNPIVPVNHQNSAIQRIRHALDLKLQIRRFRQREVIRLQIVLQIRCLGYHIRLELILIPLHIQPVRQGRINNHNPCTQHNDQHGNKPAQTDPHHFAFTFLCMFPSL